MRESVRDVFVELMELHRCQDKRTQKTLDERRRTMSSEMGFIETLLDFNDQKSKMTSRPAIVASAR